MLEAHIASPRGSFYYAGEPSPYDLETLRQHLRDALSEGPVSEIRLELILDDEAVALRLATWIGRIEQTGIQVKTLFANAIEGRYHRLPQRPVRPDAAAAPSAAKSGTLSAG